MKPIYVEVSDEITTVIERMVASTDDHLALVIPKGALLLQSLVNLKLAKKTAADAGKPLTLVTTDKIGRNLATQVGLPTVSKIEDIGADITPETDNDAKLIDGVKVHRYYEEDGSATGTGEDSESEPEKELSDPIVPRQIMREKAAVPPTEAERPIVTREVKTDAIPTTAAAEVAAAIVVPATEAAAEATPNEAASAEVGAPDETVSLPGDNAAVAAPALTAAPLEGGNLGTEKPKATRARKLAMLGVYLLILILLAATGVSAFYLPKTQVQIAIASQPWTQDLTVTAKVGDPAIPAEMITAQSDESLVFKGTGSKEIGDKAHGTATISNLDSSDTKQLPAGSQLLANGLAFTTDVAVVVPGARIVNGGPVPGSVTAPITASAPGISSNLSNVTATVTDQKLYGQIVNTSDGTTNVVALITATDIANAKDALLQKSKDDINAKLVASLQGRDVLFDASTDAFTFDAFNSTLGAGAQGDTATVNAKVTLKRLVTDRAKVKAGVQNTLNQSQSKESTYLTDTIDLTKTVVNMTDQSMAISASAKGRFSTTIATEPIRAELKGKNRAAGEALLKQAVKDGTIVIKQQPSWWPIHNFPYSDKYLQVLVKYE